MKLGEIRRSVRIPYREKGREFDAIHYACRCCVVSNLVTTPHESGFIHGQVSAMINWGQAKHCHLIKEKDKYLTVRDGLLITIVFHDERERVLPVSF